MPFPSLPVPTLPPDPHLRNPFPFPADFLPDASVAGDDIDSALTEFLAAVVPQPLPVPDIPAADEGLLDDSLYGRRVYGNGFSSTDPVAFRIPKGLDDSHTKGDKEEGLRLEASAVTKDSIDTAADGICLDWHLLSEGPCNQESCSTYASMFEDVKPCSLSSELQISCQQMPVLDIGFLNDFPRSAKLQHEDKKNEIYIPGPIPHDPSANLETTQKNMLESDVTLDITSSKQAASFSTRPRVNKLVEIHPVNLSELIQGLIKDIHVSYTSALQESAYFRHSFSDGQGLSISKQKLLELLDATPSIQGDHARPQF